MQPLALTVLLFGAVIFASAQVQKEIVRGVGVGVSDAVRVGNTMYVSGLHNHTGRTFGQETHLVLDAMKKVLESGRLTLKHVAKTTVYLTNWDNYDEMNKIYREYFPEKFPARSALQVVYLPHGSRVAIEAVAVHSDL